MGGHGGRALGDRRGNASEPLPERRIGHRVLQAVVPLRMHVLADEHRLPAGRSEQTVAIAQYVAAMAESGDLLLQAFRQVDARHLLPELGIGWVGELIALAGGTDCFAELASLPHAKDRIIADADEVVRRRPDIIIGSWCGKKFQPEAVINRPGWQDIPAVRNGMLFEIKSADILQPGPYAITHGLRQLQQIVQRWGAQQSFAKHWS